MNKYLKGLRAMRAAFGPRTPAKILTFRGFVERVAALDAVNPFGAEYYVCSDHMIAEAKRLLLEIPRAQPSDILKALVCAEAFISNVQRDSFFSLSAAVDALQLLRGAIAMLELRANIQAGQDGLGAYPFGSC
jgi:hypothetical protein